MRYVTSTLVVGLMATAATAAEYPPLPAAVSSLGAVACDGYVYIYGGHAGKTHSYDTETVLGTFHRLKIDGGKEWEKLPGGPILQGVNLATHGGKIYRVGGMSPRNKPGEPADSVSLADVAVYDPKAGKWSPLPELPAGRSSHDLVAAGDKLIVVAGWQMRGKAESSRWCDTALSLDLAAKEPKWEPIPQPFKRRALTAAAIGTKVYVIAGLTADAKSTKQIDILDTATGKWSAGPAIPGSDKVGFSPAATVIDGKLIVNTSEGPLYRLTEQSNVWEKVGTVATTRMVARIVPVGKDAVLVLGGSGKAGNVDVVERVQLAAKGEPVSDTGGN